MNSMITALLLAGLFALAMQLVGVKYMAIVASILFAIAFFVVVFL
jgi:hypothetical protein